MTLPDCMMPDGADPCQGYKELRAEVAELSGTIRLLSNVQTKLLADRDALRARVAEIRSVSASARALGIEIERNEKLEADRGALDLTVERLRAALDRWLPHIQLDGTADDNQVAKDSLLLYGSRQFVAQHGERLRAEGDALREALSKQHERAIEDEEQRVELRAENDALRELIDQINAKIGHFAGKPVAEGMPIFVRALLGIIVDIANIAAGRKG